MTNQAISADQELTVSYGMGYWESKQEELEASQAKYYEEEDFEE